MNSVEIPLKKSYGRLTALLNHHFLQKDPSKRPTAAELLKYSFFKKAKDRNWLVHSLIENLGNTPQPTISAPKKVASGKLRKDKDGNWEFEYDSAGSDSETEGTIMQGSRNQRLPISPDMKQQATAKAAQEDQQGQQQQPGQQEPAGGGAQAQPETLNLVSAECCSVDLAESY